MSEGRRRYDLCGDLTPGELYWTFIIRCTFVHFIICRCTDGIIFVVDSSQPESLEEARVELWRTMRWEISLKRELCQVALYLSLRYQDNKDIPLLVLANKQDLPSALGGPDVSQVIVFLAQPSLSQNQATFFLKSRPWDLVSAVFAPWWLWSLLAVSPGKDLTR